MPEPEQRQQIEPIHHRRGELSAWEPQMDVLNHLKVLKNIDLWTLHPKIFTLGPEHIFFFFWENTIQQKMINWVSWLQKTSPEATCSKICLGKSLLVKSSQHPINHWKAAKL